MVERPWPLACDERACEFVTVALVDIAAQFGDFLKGAMAPADYARLLPPLESLVGDYGMDPVRQLRFSIDTVLGMHSKLTGQAGCVPARSIIVSAS